MQTDQYEASVLLQNTDAEETFESGDPHPTQSEEFASVEEPCSIDIDSLRSTCSPSEEVRLFACHMCLVLNSLTLLLRQWVANSTQINKRTASYKAN